jgi:hypothetical protein
MILGFFMDSKHQQEGIIKDFVTFEKQSLITLQKD